MHTGPPPRPSRPNAFTGGANCLPPPKLARETDAQGFPPNRRATVEGGTVAGNARRELETKSGRKVVSRENYLEAPESKKRPK